VANTLKRSLLIFLSVLYFGNPLTPATALGTLLVCAGVGLYNYARMHYPVSGAGTGGGGGRRAGVASKKITL
jgi:solute carrier family 35 protein E2